MNESKVIFDGFVPKFGDVLDVRGEPLVLCEKGDRLVVIDLEPEANLAHKFMVAVIGRPVAGITRSFLYDGFPPAVPLRMTE